MNLKISALTWTIYFLLPFVMVSTASADSKKTTTQNYREMNREDYLFLKGENYFNVKMYELAEERLKALLKEFPSTKYYGRAQKYLIQIQPITDEIRKEKKAKKAVERKRQRKFEAEKKNDKKAALKRTPLSKMQARKDKVEGITWYTPLKAMEMVYGEFLGTEAPISLYVGMKQTPWLRMKVYYKADDWLFVRNAIAYVDGQKYSLNLGQFKRDNYTDIWEWSDTAPTKSDLEVIRKIINSKEAIIRFYGRQYHNDRTMKKRHKEALQESLDAYEYLKTRR